MVAVPAGVAASLAQLVGRRRVGVLGAHRRGRLRRASSPPAPVCCRQPTTCTSVPVVIGCGSRRLRVALARDERMFASAVESASAPSSPAGYLLAWRM